MIISITERELDVIIDALIHREENLNDVMMFSINPLAVKLRVQELNKSIKVLRTIRDEKTISTSKH